MTEEPLEAGREPNTRIAPHCPECYVAKGAEHLAACSRSGVFLAMDPIPQDDRFVVRVPLASDEYYRIFEMFRAGTPVPWPGRDPEVGYWIEGIEIRGLTAWANVTVARAGKLNPPA